MPIERTELLAREGAEAEMHAVLSERGVPLLVAVPGTLSVRLGRGIEHPDKFLLLVEWETLDAHAAYSQTPASAAFRALVTPLSRGGVMEHFEMEQPATA